MIKSVLGIAFLAAGLGATLAMLTMMGKTERSLSTGTLRKTHKIFGYAFVLLTVAISYMCVRYVAAAGDAVSIRAVIHGYLAAGLIVILLLKILIVRVYKNFSRFAPVIGLVIFSVAFVVFSGSAGFYFVRTWCSPAGAIMTTVGVEEVEDTRTDAEPVEELVSDVTSGDPAVGQELFELHCIGCHHADRKTARIGPGLKGLTKEDKLLQNGRPATIANIRTQIIDPAGTMPSFDNVLSKQELNHVLAYLGTL
jgi:mono/diheme cytochrome c family protein